MGDNAVIAAGTVENRDVPSEMLVAGDPVEFLERSIKKRKRIGKTTDNKIVHKYKYLTVKKITNSCILEKVRDSK